MNQKPTQWAAAMNRYRQLTGARHALDPVTGEALCGLKPAYLRPTDDPTDLNKTTPCKRCLTQLGA